MEALKHFSIFYFLHQGASEAGVLKKGNVFGLLPPSHSCYDMPMLRKIEPRAFRHFLSGTRSQHPLLPLSRPESFLHRQELGFMGA